MIKLVGINVYQWTSINVKMAVKNTSTFFRKKVNQCYIDKLRRERGIEEENWVSPRT